MHRFIIKENAYYCDSAVSWINMFNVKCLNYMSDKTFRNNILLKHSTNETSSLQSKSQHLLKVAIWNISTSLQLKMTWTFLESMLINSDLNNVIRMLTHLVTYIMQKKNAGGPVALSFFPYHVDPTIYIAFFRVTLATNYFLSQTAVAKAVLVCLVVSFIP